MNVLRNFQIPDSSRVLVLEDDFLERIPWFRSRLPKATIVQNPQIATLALDGHEFSMVFLDFNVPDPYHFNGLDTARHLATMKFSGRVVIHSANLYAAGRMGQTLRRAGIPTAVVEFGNFDINGAGEPNVVDLGEID